MNHKTVKKEPIYSALGGDPDLSEIVVMFVDEMPGRIATIEESLATADWEQLRRAAHQLKGAAGSYGFAPSSPCAAKVGDALRSGKPQEQIRATVEELIDLCRRVRAGAPA